jgi:hypothetical protein
LKFFLNNEFKPFYAVNIITEMMRMLFTNAGLVAQASVAIASLLQLTYGPTYFYVAVYSPPYTYTLPSSPYES